VNTTGCITSPLLSPIRERKYSFIPLAIQKIKEQVIPLLNQAKSLVVQDSLYVQRFETLCGYIEAFFAEKQARGGGTEEKRRAADERQNRVRDLLYELWNLFVKSNA
jgi:hypothetical protein